MKKRDWTLVLLLVPAIWFLDQITKYWALQTLSNINWYGPLGFILHRNPGAILGAFSDLPPILRVVCLSTGGAFLIFMYGAFQYLLPRKSLLLRCGMSILLGGILGNVTDRIITGSVVDFILFRFGDWVSPALNVADALQWVGYVMVIYTLIRHGEQIWPDKDHRKSIWIMPRFQWKFSMTIVGLGFAFAIISGVFSYTYLRVTLEDTGRAPANFIEERFLTPYIQVFCILSLGFLTSLFLIARILSHRLAGPIYAFEKYLDDVKKNPNKKFKLRDGDEFKHLEKVANRVRESLKKD